MKISSKSSSHLVPVRVSGREPPQVSLAISRSRRLRTSGSVNGGKASPMFRVVENPEPTSPKVTCIGQVRVKKNKRNGRKMRSRSRRMSSEIILNPQFQKSQREYLTDGNARWVHLPLAICEALRGFGADFNCFTSEREKMEEGKPGISSSCTALMVELMVEDGGERKGSQRRQLFEGIEFKEEDYSGFESVCVPPKNALLLMRCRSDPVKVAALAKRLLETSATVIEEEKEEDEEDDIHKISPEEIFKQEQEIKGDEDEKDEYPEKEAAVENGGKSREIDNELQQSNKQEEPKEEKLEGDETSGLLIQEMEAKVEVKDIIEPGEEGEKENCQPTAEDRVTERDGEEEEEEEETTCEGPESENSQTQNHKSKERDSGNSKLERESSVLPDCLLLMMYEPKLSMEVSKETWVCSTDFIRWQPAPAREKKKQVCKINDSDEPMKRGGNDNKPPERPEALPPPPRSPCSFSATTAASMVSLLEQKLVFSKAREPFSLTRCQSEPRKSAAKLAPDSFFWKGTKVEPYCSARLGLNTAWVGL